MVLATCPEPLRYVCGEGRARQRNPNTLDFVAAKLQGQIRPDVVSFPKTPRFECALRGSTQVFSSPIVTPRLQGSRLPGSRLQGSRL